MESVERFVAEQLAAWDVPGCAVAVVRDGQVELTHGWGLRDREAGLPVTQDTLFAIGSVTKAFTATSIGALVDEGYSAAAKRQLTPHMLLPDDGIGVAVLTNSSASLMHAVVACRVVDELLGAEPLDVFGFVKPSLDTMDLSLAHRHYETFDLEWHEMGDQPVLFPLTFLSAPDGDVSALTVQFEPLVEPLRFDRRPDTLSPELLRRLCGSYAMGPVEITVALRGERTLTVATPGSPPLDLEPISGLRFGVKDRPAVTAEFELDPGGTVTRLVAQPLGIFRRKAAA